MQFKEKALFLLSKAKGFFSKSSVQAYKYAKIGCKNFKEYAKIGCKRVKEYAKITANALMVAYKKVTDKVVIPASVATLKFFKRTPRAFAALVAVVVLVSSTVTVALATDATVAYSVMYNGSSIANVKDATVLAEAEILAAVKLSNPVCNPYIIDATLTQTVVSQDSLVTSDELANVLINKSEGIVSVAILNVDGEETAKSDNVEQANKALENYLKQFEIIDEYDSVEFLNKVSVTQKYLVKTSADKLPSVNAFLAKGKEVLTVKRVKTVVETETLKYETIETKSSGYVVGTRITTQKGVNGTQQVTYKVAEVNGKQVEKIKTASKVIKAAVPQKVTVGTKKATVSSSNTSNDNIKPTMLWPVKRVEKSYVSSYMGDGRGHKGMDIVAPKGTPIYAARNGVVISAGWDTSGYGYKVVIKHANGIETLYAHCSVIKVKIGDQVGEGQEIALVGSTGRSTGNHLHFEVRVNGSVVNPVKYIGRK